MREDYLARLMFYGGCAFLPWLWYVNVLYFRKKVYGPIPIWDTWLFRSDNDDNNNNVDGGTGAINGIPPLAAMSGDDEEEEKDESGGDDGFRDDHSVPPEGHDEEVSKWVKRSTFGAFGFFSLFVAWVITFQLNRDSFPPGWFIMDEDEGERTGW